MVEQARTTGLGGGLAAADFRARAQRRLPRFLFDYIDGGAGQEVTLAANRQQLDAVRLAQRVCCPVGEPQTAVALLGQDWAMPVALAPVGLAGMYARRGEVQAARAAQRAGIPFCLSTVGVCSLEETVAGAGEPPWFQLYIMRDREFVAALVGRALAAGCRTLVVTVDMPLPGTRHRDARAGLSGDGPWPALRRVGQAMGKPQWSWQVGLRGRPHMLGTVAPLLAGRTGMEDFMAWMGRNFDASVGWDDLARLRDIWPGRLLVKGVLDPRDARRAADLGADGVIVSNHGGRQLDGAPASVQALPLVAAELGGAIPVLVDGGVRSGTDVFRMVALGASGVLLGRAWAFALAADGERGVGRMLAQMKKELDICMVLTGAASIADIDAGRLAGST